MSEIRINRSRIRDPYVRFCERDGVSMINSPHPTRFFDTPYIACRESYQIVDVILLRVSRFGSIITIE